MDNSCISSLGIKYMAAPAMEKDSRRVYSHTTSWQRELKFVYPDTNRAIMKISK